MEKMVVLEVCKRVRDGMDDWEVDIIDGRGMDEESAVAGGEDTGVKLAAAGLRVDITEVEGDADVMDGVAGTKEHETGEEDTDV